ncbi:MAG: DNA polymerase III subunit beta, partial [Erysipelothrix sp.]|nr:DNA polymerase III subunit beta [Erysipelothrix sp.]
EEHILMAISNNKVQFINDHNVIQSSLLDGIYPETNRLIPNQFIAEMKISSRDMLNAIDRASFSKSDGISIVRLNMSEEKVEMSSKSQEVGSSLEVLNPISYQGEKLTLSFSGKFMTDAIRALNSSEVLIQFSGEMKPFIITTSSDESIIQLVLPVRTYD